MSQTEDKDPLELDTETDEKHKLCSSKSVKDLFSDFKPSDDSDLEVLSNESDSSESDHDSEPLSKRKKKTNDEKKKNDVRKETNSSSKKYKQKYKKDWEQIPSLKLWLSESIHGNEYFYCKLCKRDYKSGRSGIARHMGSMKHQLQLKSPDSAVCKKFTYKGMLCPVVTPFENTKAMDVNYKLIKSYGDFLKLCNVKGLLINDVLGEGMSLTIDERKKVTQHWVDVCKENEQFVMVQIGGAPLKNVIEMARHAENLKVGAIALLPDLYSSPKSHLDIIRYIKCVSRCCTNIPIFYHHYPELLPIKIDISQFLLDITGEVDLFEGIIYSTSDFQTSSSVLRISQEKFTIFIGTDEAILGAIASGFDCIVSNCLNFLPKLVDEIYQRVKNNKIESARRVQNVLNKTLDIIYANGRSTASIKAAMSVIINLQVKPTREPLENIWEGNIEKMKKELSEIGIK